MRSPHTFGIHFIIRKNKNQSTLSTIFARIIVNGVPKEISIKRNIEAKDWNSKKGMAKGSRSKVKSLNLYLEEVRSMIVECYQELNTKNPLVTADAVKNLYLGVDQNTSTLCKLMEYHNSSSIDILAPGTLKNYYTTQKYLKLYLKEYLKKFDISLSEINYRFVTEFEYFLTKAQSLDPHKPLTNNGIMKHMERFRKMLTMAARLEWIDKNPFDNYKMSFKKVERGYLSQEELNAIESKTFRIPRLDLVKDLFVFSCYTGLSYIDTYNLTPNDINIGIDGAQWIISTRQKTEEPYKVPLLPPALSIIEKYKDHPNAIAKGKLLPCLSNQKMNSYLKEIGDVCGIEKNLTFHLARHTFATTVTLSNGVSLETLSKLLGHTKITTTQIYAKVIERKVSDEMLSLKEKLYSKPVLKNKMN